MGDKIHKIHPDLTYADTIGVGLPRRLLEGVTAVALARQTGESDAIRFILNDWLTEKAIIARLRRLDTHFPDGMEQNRLPWYYTHNLRIPAWTNGPEPSWQRAFDAVDENGTARIPRIAAQYGVAPGKLQTHYGHYQRWRHGLPTGLSYGENFVASRKRGWRKRNRAAKLSHHQPEPESEPPEK